MQVDPRSRIQGPKEPADALFTDREPESAVFGRALALHRQRINTDDGPSGLRNVLVYHGMGGIGKTALSRKLEAWVRNTLEDGDAWGSPPSTAVDVTVRVDLRDAGGQFDVLGAVIAIRRSLGQLKKRWPVFDLAFAAYWSAINPNSPLPTSKSDDNGFSEAVGETVSNVLTDLDIPGTAIGLGYRTVRAIIKEFERKKEQRIAFGAYDGYENLLERCAKEPSPSDPKYGIIAEISVLLAYELSAWKNGPSPLVVVFIDTLERLNLDPRRTGERHLNQLVYSMPNVLFVMTGRDSIDWYNQRRTNLHAAGEAVWPGLVPGANLEPRQHLVGKLSPSDRRRVITLGREIYKLPMSDRVIDHLVITSGGLPQYLEIALIVARSVVNNGGIEVTTDDVNGSLSDLVVRVLEDVPADEQRALRAASMFPYFDSELVAVAAEVEFGCAQRACRRPMVEKWENSTYPYRIHDEVRAAIRSADHKIVGGWTEHDWRRAASRALEEARRRYEAAAEDEDGQKTLFALGLAIRIVCAEEVTVGQSDVPGYEDWLSSAIIFGPSISGLRSHVPTISSTDYGQSVLDVIIAKDVGRPVAERLQLLRRVFDSTHPLSLPAGRHLAYTFRNNSKWDDSLLVWDELLTRMPNDLHRYQRALTLLTARRFTEAAACLPDLPDGRKKTLNAILALAHGRPNEWFAQSPATIESLRGRRRQREVLEQRGIQLRLRSLVLGDTDVVEVMDTLSEAESVGHDAALRDCLAAMALLSPTRSGSTKVDLEYLEWLDRAHNDGELGFRAALVFASQAFIRDNEQELHQLRNRLNNYKKPRGRSWVPVECLLDSLGLPLDHQEAQWVEPYVLVRQRWRNIFDDYRARALSLSSNP